jgi:hypothetical protein
MGEFPPRAMTGYETYMEGHGVFKASASSFITGWETWRAFNHIVGGEGYHSGSGDSYTSGTYDGTNSLGGYSGAWISLELPYKIQIDTFKITGRVSWPHRSPVTGVLLASNDNVHWDKLHEWSSVTFTDYQYTNFKVNNTDKYSHFAIVATALDLSNGDSLSLQISEWKLFGTRERGQSTLHDGSLTLTKNLTVPRIGPPLDADDTPRRDRLVVEYNTSTNPTANGTVKDTSGRGNDGLFYGGASYDATEKVLDTPNSTGIIGKNINLPGGNIPLSVSAWFRLIDTTTVTNDTIVCLGTNSTATGGGSFILRVNTDQLRINFEQSSNYTEFTKTISNRIWYHVVATYDGGTSASGRKLFIDGVEIAQTSTSGTITGVNLPVNPGFTVGMRTSINGYLNGSISQFKLYDTALTADEVKRLYDMGRLGNVIAQPVHIAAPLYAPGTICQVGIVHFPRDNISISTGQTKTLTTFNFKPKFANSRLFFTLTIYCQAGNLYWNIWVYRNDSDRITSHSTGNYGITGQNYTGVGGGHQVRVGQGYDDPNTTESQKYSVKFVNDNQATAVTLGVAGPHLLKIEEICQ